MQSSEVCDCIIPSLYTFFRDVLYLEACSDAVKWLVIPSKKYPTVRTAMNHIFQHNASDEGCPVQTSEAAFRIHADAGGERFELGYRQIWLYAMRHYPDMAKDSTSEDVVAKASRTKADKAVLYNIAVLARKLGFCSPQIEQLLSHSSDREIAREALLKARKPDYYRYNSIESLIDFIIERCFGTAHANESLPLNEPNVSSQPLALKRRCGPPHKQSQLLDRPLLFVDRLHSEEKPARTTVSSLFVRRCVYFAFFGKLSSLGRHQNRVASSSSGASPIDIPLSPLFVPDHHSPQGGLSLGQNVVQHRSINIQRDDRRLRKHARRDRHRQRRETPPRRTQQRRSKQPSERQSHPFLADTPAVGVDTDMDSPSRDDASVDEDASMGAFLTDHSSVDEDNAMVDPPRRDASADEDASMGNSLTDHSSVDEDIASASLFNVGDIENSHSTCEKHEVELIPDAEQTYQDQCPHRAEELMPTETPEQEQPQSKANEPERFQLETEHRVDAATPESPLVQNEGSEQDERERDQSEKSERTARTHAIVTDSQTVTKERTATRRILEGDQQEHLLQATNERVAAEHAIQGTLQQLQSEADARALNESAAEGSETEHDVEDRAIAQVGEPMPPPGLVDEAVSIPTSHDASLTMGMRGAPDDRPQAGPEEQSLASSVPADIMQQSRVPRNARTAKAVTQIELTGLVDNTPAEQEQEFNPGQHEWPITSRSRNDEVGTSRPDTNTTVAALQTGDGVKQKKTSNSVTIGHEDAPQTLGEVMVPPLPAHARPRRTPPPNAVTITFRAYEMGKWHVVDRILVDPADPSEAERVAHKYAREENKDARFYNQALRKVSVMQCVRAALNGGTNTVLITLGMDLAVTQNKVAEVTRMLKADAEKAASVSDGSVL